ncbi:GH25 family lysozyme [Gryllotalpicola reticulitermitis]|uniref:GH25 family lysozyme n=1 Tax=Gryllotalpicola reticulitermitis TaxID=1184153 RepID=A0ABV8Q9G8_9MICO
MIVAVVIVVVIANRPTTKPHAAVKAPGGGVVGVDASGAVNWASAPLNTKFAYVEATDHAKANAHFAANWKGAEKAGLLRGAYHFGVPNKSASNGATQAKFFFAHGGNYPKDGTTLPPVLDVEFDPNGGKGTSDPTQCWALTPAQSSAWITSYVHTLASLSGRTPVVYTSKSYWQDCLGGASDVASSPLWIVDTSTAVTPAVGFGGWSTWSLRQFAIGQQHGAFDYDEFNGTTADLTAFASH